MCFNCIFALWLICGLLDSAQALQPETETTGTPYPHILSVEPYTLNTRNVKVLKSQKNFLWIGTTLGAIRYDVLSENDYTIFDNKNHLLSNGIFSLAIDPEGLPWIGTYGGGISRFDGKQWVNLNTPNGLADAFVFDIKFTPQATWIATWSGVNRIKGNTGDPKSLTTFTVENTQKGLIDNWVYSIQTGKGGRVWFGTESGISLYENGKWKSWNHDSGLGAALKKVAKSNRGVMDDFQGTHHNNQHTQGASPKSNFRPNYVLCMLLDHDENLWIGTWGGGLSLFDTRTHRFRNFTTHEGLPGNFILSLREDASGKIWIGTNNGLSRFNGKVFTNFGKINGLNSDFIFSLEFTLDHSFWLGGHYGVDRLRMHPKDGRFLTIQ